ncbi:Gti1/Pac2 family-domain-containing protein [Fimicolochytrium jonesii]|uniref:Gti1/Pac2 family-domain-containing protein n=1 Tax=Fimicolochytrium jonesii TaxID=1396493 RepID=UPI0022FDEF28|nr:Gti1/Pac2 family-domain-containing protein [Fimicolochytrium jonesii]KAI8818544.1 Gti1/Pac2 family-domain-containing protein [Fimicolochytrium jonesii]
MALVLAPATSSPIRAMPTGPHGGGSAPTYHGYIGSTQDCLLLFEACRVGMLRRVQRRLSVQERERSIKSGSVFVWEEDESGIKRWTDSKSWSPSRIKGSFLVYREVDEVTARRRASSAESDDEPESKQRSKHPPSTAVVQSQPRRKSSSSRAAQQGDPSPNSPDLSPLLTKKCISVRTKEGGKLHAVCYYTKSDVTSGRLQTPREDPHLANLAIRAGLYPEILPEISLLPVTAAAAAAAANAAGAMVRVTHQGFPPGAALDATGPHGPNGDEIYGFGGHLQLDDYSVGSNAAVAAAMGVSDRRISTDLSQLPPSRSGRKKLSSGSRGSSSNDLYAGGPIIHSNTRGQYRNHPYASAGSPRIPAGYAHHPQTIHHPQDLTTPSSPQYSTVDFTDTPYYRDMYNQHHQQQQHLSNPLHMAHEHEHEQQTRSPELHEHELSPHLTEQALSQAPAHESEAEQESNGSPDPRLPPLRRAVSREEEDGRWGSV